MTGVGAALIVVGMLLSFIGYSVGHPGPALYGPWLVLIGVIVLVGGRITGMLDQILRELSVSSRSAGTTEKRALPSWLKVGSRVAHERYGRGTVFTASVDGVSVEIDNGGGRVVVSGDELVPANLGDDGRPLPVPGSDQRWRSRWARRDT